MKIKVWTMACDTDQGTTAEVFASEDDAMAAWCSTVRTYWDSDLTGEPFPVDAAGEPDHEAAWQRLTGVGGVIDSFHIEAHEIEVPAPAHDALLKALRELVAAHDARRDALVAAHDAARGAIVAAESVPGDAFPITLQAMWEFASGLVEKHGMNGDDTMTDAEHAAWRDAAGWANALGCARPQAKQ